MNNHDIDSWFESNGLANRVQREIIPPCGHWHFHVGPFPVRIQTQESANRMRIVAYIAEADRISHDDFVRMMEANSHSALDARYALDNGYIVSLFLHPFRELNLQQFVLGFYQVISCAETHGTDYSGGTLSYGPTAGNGSAAPMEQGATHFEQSLVAAIRNV